MKKLITTVLMLGATLAALSADSYGTVSGLLRFHGSIAELAIKNASIDPNKLYLVEGMITSVNLINDSATDFYAEAEFMSANYTDDEAIQTHHIVLVFSKADYQKLLVARSGKPLLDNQIGVNTRGLALIQYINSVPAENGGRIPVFIAHDFRVLK